MAKWILAGILTIAGLLVGHNQALAFGYTPFDYSYSEPTVSWDLNGAFYADGNTVSFANYACTYTKNYSGGYITKTEGYFYDDGNHHSMQFWCNLKVVLKDGVTFTYYPRVHAYYDGSWYKSCNVDGSAC